MNCLLILSLAVLGASASPCGLVNTISGCSSPCGVVNTAVSGCASALPGRTICAQTPVLENPVRVIPHCVSPTSVSQSCHCLRTVVRPQIRNEIITVPSVDRIVRVVNSPVVEAVSVNCGGNTRNYQVPTCGVNTGIVESGIVGGIYPRAIEGIVGGCGQRVVEGIVGGSSCGFGGVLTSGVVGNVGCGSIIA